MAEVRGSLQWDQCFKTKSYEFGDDKFEIVGYEDDFFTLTSVESNDSTITRMRKRNGEMATGWCKSKVYFVRNIGKELAGKVGECLFRCGDCEYGYLADPSNKNIISTITEIQSCECGRSKVIL